MIAESPPPATGHPQNAVALNRGLELLEWTTEQLVRAAREHDVQLHFTFTPIKP